MKKTIFFLILFSIFLFYLKSYALENLDFMHVISYEGDVAIKKEDTKDWIQIDLNMPIEENDELWVSSNSRLELRTKNGSFIRLNEYSAMDVFSLSSNGYQLYSDGGDIYVNYKSDYSSILQFDTPSITVKAFDNARFRVEIFDNGETEITVYEGEVIVENKSDRWKVKKDYKVLFNEDDILEKSKIYGFDEWEKWNIDRDKIFTVRNKSIKYLPDELHAYSYDFDKYGKWVYEERYGYVWQPTVIVINDWAPYRHGYWMWISGDYVWISLEPWGWVPYHYGRWIYSSRYGWLWVPPTRGLVYWGPGFVGWVYTDDYVCWVPLAPGEVYYGYRYYGPYSVKINNVNINVTKIVYKNISVPNGYTVIHKKNFLTANLIFERVFENPFLSPKAKFIRPDFDRENIRKDLVGKKFIKEDRRPPEFLLERKLGVIKDKKPFVVKESPEMIKKQKILEEKDGVQKDKYKTPVKEELKRSKNINIDEIKPVVKEKKVIKKREKFKIERRILEKKGERAPEKEKHMDKEVEKKQSEKIKDRFNTKD